jgi:hypothetical protein
MHLHPVTFSYPSFRPESVLKDEVWFLGNIFLHDIQILIFEKFSTLHIYNVSLRTEYTYLSTYE